MNNCRLCSGSHLKLYYQQGHQDQYNFYKCANCGLVNLNLENINLIENQEKYANTFPDPHNPRKNKGSFQTYLFIRNNLKKKGKYLDIGCGNGSLLLYSRNIGWQVHGLELSDFLARNIKAKLDIDVDVANFLEYEGEKSQYDLVSLRHVLEHLPDSVLALQKINDLLAINGYALLEFPNIEGFSFRLKRLMTKLGMYKKKYSEDYAPGHCNEFSKKSWKFLLKETGFELVRWETYSSKKFISIIFRIFPIGIKARTLIRKVK